MGCTQRSSRGGAWFVVGVFGLLVPALAGERLGAEFSEPVAVSESGGKATEVSLSLDTAGNAYVASIVDGKLRVDLIGPNRRSTHEIPASAPGQGEPVVAVNTLGVAYLCYSETDPDPSDTGREVYLVTNNGGQFNVPVNISEGRVDDSAPQLAIDGVGFPRVVWSRTVGESSQVYFYNYVTGEKQPIASGTYPNVAVSDDGRAHVVYARDNDLYYKVTNDDGLFDEDELRIVETPTEAEFGAHLGVNDAGDVFIVYVSEGSLYLISKTDGVDFDPPLLLDSGGALDPELRMRQGGGLSIAYTRHGDVHYILGLSSFLLAPERMGDATVAVESQPNVVVDRQGNIHGAFVRDGDVYYRNNVGEIRAEFTAAPRDGEGPLKVEFQDLSSGPVHLWQWDFDDGTTSNIQNPVHTFSEPRKYTVSLTVYTTDKDSSVVKEDFVVVQEPFNSLRIPDQSVLPNQKDVWFPILASHRDPIQGFQLHGVYDPRILTLKDITDSFSVVEPLAPEVWETNFEEIPGRFEVGVIFELKPPFDHSVLPSGSEQTILNLVFDVTSTAPQGAVTTVDLVNNAEISRIVNVFTVDRFSKLPTLTGSTVKVLPLDFPLPRFFIRGDVDGSEIVELTDAVVLLTYLFVGGVEVECEDAADTDDRGDLDLTDAIGILSFLFTGGAPPGVPFPFPGLDPSDDTLACE